MGLRRDSTGKILFYYRHFGGLYAEGFIGPGIMNVLGLEG